MKTRMKQLVFLVAGCLVCSEGFSEEKVTEYTTKTKTETEIVTVITETVVKEKVKWSPFKVCVLDFSTIDIKGDKRFLDEKNRPINIPIQSTLNSEARASMDGYIQGYVQMIDAWDTSRTNQANRDAQVADNAFTRERAVALFNDVVRGEPRASVIGADYLSAYLGKYNDVFTCIDNSLMERAMEKLRHSPDFPKDFMLRLARETGVTHLIYATVSDIRTKSTAFKGYGIETNNTFYQLDVIVKMVDLVAQHGVYSNVYTGSEKIMNPATVTTLDSDMFMNLMKNALQNAAEDIYGQCRPGRKNRITVTPFPEETPTPAAPPAEQVPAAPAAPPAEQVPAPAPAAPAAPPAEQVPAPAPAAPAAPPAEQVPAPAPAAPAQEQQQGE